MISTASIAKNDVMTKVGLFAFFLAIVSVVPAFLHSQWITGPMVNAALIAATVFVGPGEAMLLGLMPSTVALATGLLPLPLAPMVPFIMISNAILVAVFHRLRLTGFWPAMATAALLKFGFLNLLASLVLKQLIGSGPMAKVALMVSWPQLVTALLGGVIVYPLLRNLK